MPSLDINRINIALHNMSADVAEQAIEGLATDLGLRLQMMRIHDLSSMDVGELSVGPIKQEAPFDAASLRALLVDNIIQQITQLREGSAS